MHIILAVVALLAGLLAGGFGFLAAADPEGRGGAYLLLIPLGGVVALGAAVYLVWVGARALFGG